MNLFAFTLRLILSLVPEAPEQERLAMAIATAAEERPIIRGDEAATAALLVSVAFWESGQSFDCTRVGDRGHSISCWQLWVCPGPRCGELTADVFQAARVARDMLATSMHVCRQLPLADRLAQFTTGRCVTNKESRIRWATGERLFRRAEGRHD